MQSEPHPAPASTSTLAETVEACHKHCASCVNRRCAVKPQAGTSCDLTACPLACGAAFHSCKIAEHRLLCPLETVPCLNGGFGCPVALVRRRMPSHLEVCPAGLVCCTMAWTEWLVSCQDHTSQLSHRCCGVEEPEQLDTALALQEQQMLLEAHAQRARQVVAIGIKECVAAHLDSPESPPEASSSSRRLPLTSPGMAMPLLGFAPPPLPGSAKERIANGINGLIEEDYGQLYEATLETTRSLVAALDVFRICDASECSVPCAHQGDGAGALVTLESSSLVSRHCRRPKAAQHATAWTRCTQTLACLPNRRTLRSSGLAPYDKPPYVSLGVAQRASHIILEDRAPVVLEDREHRFQKPQVFGHGVGPFTSSAGQWGPPPDRSHPTSPLATVDPQQTFSFTCGQAFRRDQFSWHSANVHADIHAGLSGWMEHRCPLACYGCTFSQRRLCPAGPGGAAGEARVVHDGRLQSFGVQQCPVGGPPLWGGPPSDQITGLPMEILWHIAGFLDSFSLCQLSVVSRGMRDVCAGLLETRGVVELQWVRRQGPPPHNTASWHVKNKVWRFSTAFSAVPRWRFIELPSMSDHLRTCRYNTPEPKTEPVPLPAMCTAHGGGHSLRSLLHPVNK
ncbi:hypothetical protein CRUP_015782 [Coryphaenoides rupestris]|nr:hypothetical protein CRUP_015782 [Coryphaenoides rupestris]